MSLILDMVNTSPGEPTRDLTPGKRRESTPAKSPSGGGLYFGSFGHSCTQQVVEFDLVQVHKKFKAPSIRKWITSAVKGRRKDKEATPMNIQDEECRQYLEDEFTNEQICDVDFCSLVELPHGLDYNEWLATHTITFFEHISLMYDTISEFCTSSGCCNMTGPANSSYVWEDSRGKKCKCSAPQYVDYVMSHSQTCVCDESVFPTKYGNLFPSSFESTVRKIHRLLFHVIAHIYHSHYKEIVQFKLHAHLNTLFLHFMAFSRHFKLLEDHKESECLDALYAKLVCANIARRHPDKPVESNGDASPVKSSGDCLPPPPSAHDLEENKENLMEQSAEQHEASS